MKYLSVCSGIEAATVAWGRLLWEPVAFSEIEPFPSAVLAHRFPWVHNLGDMTEIDGKKYRGTVDVLVGGTPCQSFSIAGLRDGLADDRGNLALHYCRLIKEVRPKWFVWENVPGVLSSNGGRDFGTILGAMAELGYGLSWRVLDAQNFGVPQRRRRVFVVGHLGDWRPAAAVLFEPESVCWNPPKGKQKRKEVAKGVAGSSGGGSHWSGGTAHPSLTQCTKASGSPGYSDQELFSQGGAGLVPSADREAGKGGEHIAPTVGALCPDVSPSLTSSGPPFSRTGNSRVEADAMVVTPINDKATRCQGGGPTRDNDGAGNGLGVGKEGDPSPTLTGGDRHAVAYRKSRRAKSKDDYETWVKGEQSNTLNCFDDAGDVRATHAVVEPATFKIRGGSPTYVDKRDGKTKTAGKGALVSDEKAFTVGAVQDQSLFHNMAVRRLTPVECERLQGFPDNYTRIPWRGKPEDVCPDGNRYRAIGNSMAVPVMLWIGERIQKHNEE